MAKKIYVGNLNFRTTEDGLRDLFSQHGDVTDVRIIIDRETRRSRGFGFVEMSDDASADAAIDALNNFDLDGRPLKVNEAIERTDRAPRPRRY